MRSACVPPRPSPICGTLKSARFFKSPTKQTFHSCIRPLHLSPQNAPEFSSNPAIQFLKYPFHFSELKIVSPPSEKRIKSLQNKPPHIAPSSRSKAFPEFRFHSSDRLLCHLEAWTAIKRHLIAEKLSSFNTVYGTFGLVYF